MPQAGNLQVILGPAGAITDGAQWNVDWGAWQNGGNTVSGLSVGWHTVYYKSITGWDAPAVSEPVSITNGQTTQISRNYIQQQSQHPQFGILNGKSVKITLKDAYGNDVTFSLAGAGYGEVTGGANFDQIILYGTGEKSALTISSKAKDVVSVGDIICNGPMKGITAKGIDVTGNIEIGSPAIPNPKAAVTITFDEASGLTINSDMPIKSITATEWVGGAINAPSVASLTIKGDKKRGISGDLADVELNLSKGPDVKVMALGKLTVKGWIDSSRILSKGNIGTVTAGGIADSSCFAGITATSDVNFADGVPDLPGAEATNFNGTVMIKSFAIKGIKTESPPYVINSNIAAANISGVTLSYPQNTNGGVPFGLSAGFIKSVKIKDAEGTTSFKNLDKPGDSLKFDDAEIRLY